jgi:hypothetical protein
MIFSINRTLKLGTIIAAITLGIFIGVGLSIISGGRYTNTISLMVFAAVSGMLSCWSP